MTTTSVGSPRPTDAEIIKMLRGGGGTPSRRDRKAVYRHAIRRGEALMMASALEGAEPSPLAHITTIGQLFEVIDYDFDGSGLTVTDGNLLANTIANTFPALTNDMPHLVKTDDEAGSLHRPDCSPDCSTHHRMTNEAPYNALVVPEAEKEPQKSPQTAKQAALALAYDRSQAAAAIVRAVRQWRESLAGMSNADIAAALDAVWQAGEEYDALREED